MSLNNIECKNCGNMFHGHYCNNCGQKSAIHRISLKNLLHDFFHATTHLDRGYLHTAKEMFIRPGHTIREYLQGKRVSHPNPILMMIITGGLCSLMYYNLELQTVSAFKINELGGGTHIIESKFFAILYISYSLLLSFFDFIFFRKKGYNFTEFFSLNVFISIEILLSLLILVPVWLIGKSLEINVYLRLIVGFGFIAYLVYVRYQFFEINKNPQSKWILIIESLLFLTLFLLISYRNILEVLSA
ncbi:MAG: DUF3667 domain-containing protein [Nitrosomonas sp.]|nr:DUF3667 domain-containing protein [Nitrosomonas sp.]